MNSIATSRRPVVLVVDDQPQVLMLYARALEEAGYEAKIAFSAEGALRMIQRAMPDAVLVDLKMPYVNGIGLLYRVRKLYPELPAAVMTGADEVTDETMSEVATLHAAIYVKPLSNAKLAQVVGNLLRTRPHGPLKLAS